MAVAALSVPTGTGPIPLALDGLDAWCCSIFRNESAGLSSELIEAAMALTAERWSDRPADHWLRLTWIDTTKVRSSNPGYCFKQAGWWVDREWTHPRLIRLRAKIDPAGQSTPGHQEVPHMIDIRQQRCGDGCIAWRLSRPGSAGQEWRPCWSCGTTEHPDRRGSPRGGGVNDEERAIVLELVERALTTDGAHHKQWYLEQIAFQLELPITVDREPGIAP